MSITFSVTWVFILYFVFSIMFQFWGVWLTYSFQRDRRTTDRDRLDGRTDGRTDGVQCIIRPSTGWLQVSSSTEISRSVSKRRYVAYGGVGVPTIFQFS